jgi:hypothetical protein
MQRPSSQNVPEPQFASTVHAAQMAELEPLLPLLAPLLPLLAPLLPLLAPLLPLLAPLLPLLAPLLPLLAPLLPLLAPLLPPLGAAQTPPMQLWGAVHWLLEVQPVQVPVVGLQKPEGQPPLVVQGRPDTQRPLNPQ